MTLQDEVEPILNKIWSEARERWEKYLTNIPAEDQQRNATEWQKIGKEYYGTVEDVIARIRKYYALDAHDFQNNVQQLAETPGDRGSGGPMVKAPLGGTAMGCVHSAQANFMAPVEGMIDGKQWNSPSAIAFEENFLKPFGKATQWHAAYASELALAAIGLQVATARSKRSIKFVAESCLGALQGHQKYQGDLGFKDTSKDMPGKSLAEGVGVLTGIAGLIASGPIGWAIGAIGLASGLYSLSKRGGTEPYLQIDYSDSPQTIIQRTEIAIKNLEEWIADQDEDIATGLNQDLKSDMAFGSKELRLPPPGIGAGSFKQLGFTDKPGGLNLEVESVVSLGRAGAYNLPDAASQYAMAAGYLENCQVPGSVSQFFPRSVSPFNTAAGQLADILRDTRDGLNRAGDAMVTAARNYQTTDDDRAEIIRRIDIVPTHRTIAATK